MNVLRLIPLLAAIPFPLTALAQLQPPAPQRSISITATAHVTNLADTATVHIGFLLYGPDKDTAYATGSQASNTIATALKKAGIPADAIESQSQNLAASQPYELEKLSNSEKAAHAFKIEQSWTVRTPADDANKVLDLAIKSGANNSGAIDWSLHDPNLAETAAATRAIQRAREQASAMASGLNVHLGSLLSASNSVEEQPIRPVMAMKADRFRGGGLETLGAAPLALNPRQIETSATVTAVFAIE